MWAYQNSVPVRCDAGRVAGAAFLMIRAALAADGMSLFCIGNKLIVNRLLTDADMHTLESGLMNIWMVGSLQNPGKHVKRHLKVLS